MIGSAVVDQRRDRLREHHDALEAQRFAHAADEPDLVVAADHALVGVLVDLDAAAAAVLGGLAGDLRLGDAVIEMQVARRWSTPRPTTWKPGG